MGIGIMDQQASVSTERENRAPLGFPEFVALVAAMMALTALGIDSMLPALPAIGQELDVASANSRQYVITAYLLGFSVPQLIYGPMSDRFGRRPVLGFALLAYVVTSGIAALSGSFELLLLSRVAMGAAAAGARVVVVALVRDCYAGRAMARVMSLAFIVFMAAPILAPSLGQAIMFLGSWRLIFWAVGACAALVFIWFWMRMPETLPQSERLPLSARRILRDYRTAASDRCAVGYTLGIAALSGGMFGFLGSIPQIMDDVFHAPEMLGIIFPCVASTMAVASFVNSRLVMKLGMRRISHWALVGMITVAALHLVVSLAGSESLWSFTLLQAAMMGFVGLSTSNFSAMAMERMGHIAGTASSLQGFVTTLGGALIGAVIGQSFDGTTVPLYAGYLSMGLLAFAIIFVAERGRMFRPV